MILIHNRQKKIRINTTALKKNAQLMLNELGYQMFDLGILITTNASIRKLNNEYRNKDKATDILSFPFHENLKPGQKIVIKSPEDTNLGDLIISAEYVINDAPKRWGRFFDDHFDALLAHGIAHLLQYDHQTDAEFKQMQKVEKKLLSAIGKAHLLEQSY